MYILKKVVEYYFFSAVSYFILLNCSSISLRLFAGILLRVDYILSMGEMEIILGRLLVNPMENHEANCGILLRWNHPNQVSSLASFV
jgi:hypothetical protein